MSDTNINQKLENIPIFKYKCISSLLNASILCSLHNHKEFEIILIQKGSARVKVEKTNSFIAKEGDILCFSPYMLHYIDLPENSSCEYICFRFDLSLVCSDRISSGLESRNHNIVPLIPKHSPHNATIASYFFAINDAIESKAPYWDMNIRGNLSLMFAHLYQNGLYEKNSDLANKPVFCLSVIKFLEDNYQSEITSKTVSLELNYNQSYFCRNFKRSFYSSFNEYLCLFRCNKAQEMLRQRDLSITDIAYATGFSSASYFTKSFKKVFGVTPQKYRHLFIE